MTDERVIPQWLKDDIVTQLQFTHDQMHKIPQSGLPYIGAYAKGLLWVLSRED